MLRINDIVTKLPSVRSNGQRKPGAIKYAVVHHSAVLTRVGYDPLARYVSEAKYHVQKGFGRLAYHFCIDIAGIVRLTNRLEEVTYHAGNLAVNAEAVGICLDGDFGKQSLPERQRAALVELLDYLCLKRPDMPKLVKATVKTHREVRLGGGTSCPSDAVQKIVEAYRRA